MTRLPRPCLDCGTLTTNGPRCEAHALQAERARSRQRGRRHYTGTYDRDAKQLRATATACHWCPRPFTDTDPVTADHLLPGDPASPLVPAHRSCNSSRGNRERPGA